ncbi:hypothetical protein [Azonexus fungiphilus]|uniref:hypothetical protein n=1 Tax=Azonexus fungiphilus TaxID=146940 RepID=UPI0011C42A19|nr:hypothetical protein [Azonexus fungiphilus]
MLRIELRQMFRSNGLIDDIVIYGTSEDYRLFAEQVSVAISSSEAVALNNDSSINLEISKNNASVDLFTSLQNSRNEYSSMQDWLSRNVLRISGSESQLGELSAFLFNLSSRGEGYSYISDYSESSGYSSYSPEWRLHVENS